MAELTETPIDKGPKFAKVSEIEERAEDIRRKRDLPKSPGRGCTLNEMFQWLKLLTPEMQSRIVIYLYRHRPLIIRQMANPDALNNIDVISDGLSTLDEGYFIERHGGGKYGLMVKDSDLGDKGKLFEVKFEIPMSQYPPKLDLHEVDWTVKENIGFRSWARAQNLINENNEVMEDIKTKQANVASQGTSADVAPMLKMMLDFATKMSEKDQNELKRKLGGEDAVATGIKELMLEKMKQDDPNKTVTTLTTLMAAMKPSGDGGIANIMPMFIQMMQMQSEASNRQFTMMMELMKGNKVEGGEGGGKISELRELIGLAKELKGGSTQARSTGEIVVDVIKENLTPALNIISNIVALRAQGKPLPAIQPSPTGVTGVEAMPIKSPNQPNQPNVTADEATHAIRQFAPLILSNLSKPGYEFASWVAEGFPQGDMIVATIIKNGADSVLGSIKNVSELWNQIESTYGEAHLIKWLEEFVNYKEIIAELDNEPDTAVDDEPQKKT